MQVHLSVGVPKMTLTSEILSIQKMDTQTHWTRVKMILNAFDEDYDHDGCHNYYELNVNTTWSSSLRSLLVSLLFLPFDTYLNY